MDTNFKYILEKSHVPPGVPSCTPRGTPHLPPGVHIPLFEKRYMEGGCQLAKTCFTLPKERV